MRYWASLRYGWRVIEDRAVLALRAVLPRSTPFSLVRVGDRGSDVTVNGVEVEMCWVGEGDLGRIRQLLAGRRRRPDVVVARELSPGARAALEDAGVGWVDETGAAELVLPGILVSRTGRPVRRPHRLPRWSGSVFAAAEALLVGTKPTVAAVCEATGLSTGTSTSALRALTDLGLLSSPAGRGRNSGRVVDDVERLLRAYAAARAPERLAVSIGLAARDPIDALVAAGRPWSDQGIEWAVTGTAAAHVLAPLLSEVTSVETYVAASTVPALEATAEAAGLRPIEGGRLTLRPFPTVTTNRLATTVAGLRVAPWPRVFVDLSRLGVRGEDAAEHLWETQHGRG